VVTTNAGFICYDADFYPFGGERAITNTCPQNYKFTGKERDYESGLDNFGARYMSSGLGRFMTPDWSASPSPVPYASLPYPQSLNLYSYVQNNPLKSTDPTGHCTVDGETHGWVWCAAHSLGFTETKKEIATREKQEAEWRAFVAKHPQYSTWNMIQGPLVILMTAGAMGAAESGGGSDSTVTPEENAAIDAEAAAGAEAGVARTMVNGVPQPAAEGEIVVGPNGTAVKIPAGYVAEPAQSGSGIVYRPAGSTGNANTIRVMGPNATQGARVIIYNSQGQPIIPSTGKPGPPALTHTPLQ
jgi:RHS repeat-associated protein